MHVTIGLNMPFNSLLPILAVQCGRIGADYSFKLDLADIWGDVYVGVDYQRCAEGLLPIVRWLNAKPERF